MAYKMSAEDKKREMEWQTQEDVRMLKRMQELQSDKSRMSRAQAMIDKEMKGLQSARMMAGGGDLKKSRTTRTVKKKK